MCAERNADRLELADRIELRRDELTLELALWPFSFTLRRRGRRLIGGGGLWAAEGSSRDQLLHFTEAVLTHELRAPAARALRAEVDSLDEHSVELRLPLHGSRRARARFALDAGQRLTVRFVSEGEAMRVGIDWGRRADERLVGLGLRHGTTLDQAGRDVQLGADRRYTGPDCPPEMLEVGGIPQGDCAPMPWLNSSRSQSACTPSRPPTTTRRPSPATCCAALTGSLTWAGGGWGPAHPST